MFDFLKKKISSWISKKEEKPSKQVKKKSSDKKEKAGKPSKIIKVRESEKIAPIIKEEIKKHPEKKTTSEKVSEKEVEKIIEESETPEEPKDEKKENFFTKLLKKISSQKLTEEDFEEAFQDLELTLLENNVALEAVDKIKSKLSSELIGMEFKKTEAEPRILNALKDSILSILIEPPNLIKNIKEKSKEPYVIVFFGINGTEIGRAHV